jgi:ribosomal protein S18 acetylase RimI-like enzyme
MVRRPDAADRTAVAAATVVFPTPPLPVNSKMRTRAQGYPASHGPVFGRTVLPRRSSAGHPSRYGGGRGRDRPYPGKGAYRGQLPDELLDELSVETDTVRFADHLGHLAPERRVWVAEEDGEVIGFASTGPSRDEDAIEAAEVYAIYVLPDRCGHGIGRALLDHAMEDLRQRGYREVLLWTLTTNVPAQRFYERQGWRTDGTTKLDRLDRFALNETRYRLDLHSAGPASG